MSESGESRQLFEVSSIAIKNEPIYHYIMDGSGTSGQYLPVVTIGADGQLRAVTDPTCLPVHPDVQPVDISEEVIVFPDKSMPSDTLPEGIVEIDVDAASDEVQDNIEMAQSNQIPIVTTFLAPNKNVTIGGIQYIQTKSDSTSLKVIPTVANSGPAFRKAKFQCKVCLKTFSQQVNLQTHYRIHTGERPYECQVCKKAFTQQPNLWKHMRTHTGERPFQCRTCQKCFTQQGNLSKHEKIHTGERPFKCSQCDKTFAQRSNLMTHLTLHTGVRPFKCQVCDKSFAQRANLLTHNMTHTGERPYKCEVCEKGFSQQANLVKHLRLHTGERPYSCRFCNRTFAQQANLDRHERIHTGVKPYACTQCWRAFGQKTNLQKHEATHHQEKQFPCLLCKKKFVVKASLEKHQLKVHAHQMYPNCCAGKAHSKDCAPPSSAREPIEELVELIEEEAAEESSGELAEETSEDQVENLEEDSVDGSLVEAVVEHLEEKTDMETEISSVSGATGEQDAETFALNKAVKSNAHSAPKTRQREEKVKVVSINVRADALASLNREQYIRRNHHQIKVVRVLPQNLLNEDDSISNLIVMSGTDGMQLQEVIKTEHPYFDENLEEETSHSSGAILPD